MNTQIKWLLFLAMVSFSIAVLRMVYAFIINEEKSDTPKLFRIPMAIAVLLGMAAILIISYQKLITN